MEIDAVLEAMLLSIQLEVLHEIQRETEEHPAKWFAHLSAALMEDKLTRRLSQLHTKNVPRDAQEFIAAI